MKIIGFCTSVLLAMALSAMAMAGPDDRRDGPRLERGHSHQVPDRHHRAPPPPRVQHHQHAPQHHHRPPQHRPPQHRPGPAYYSPGHGRLRQGHRLPRGYGAPPPRYYVRHLPPHRRGYEWRRVGSDMVLVAVATGIVTQVLYNVLH
jgi:Ni/Co efflux regulator RcnB